MTTTLALRSGDRVVAQLAEAARLLEHATTIAQAKVIADVAAAQQVFAQRQQLGDDIVGYAYQIKTYALAKLGELLKELPKAPPRPGPGRGKVGQPAQPTFGGPATLAELGLTKQLASVAQQLADLPLPVRDAIANREVTLVQANRDHHREHNRAVRLAQPFPVGRFRLLYADPPWEYEHPISESRAIDNQYPTMTLDAICALRVPAADDAVLFLWATSPKLAEAMQVIEAWAFTYRTCAVWDKERIGMGYYFRQQHELLLVATKGSLPAPAPAHRPASIIRAPRLAHSEKPKEVYALLEAMYPEFGDADRIELFTRDRRPGWSPWGNEPALAG